MNDTITIYYFFTDPLISKEIIAEEPYNVNQKYAKSSKNNLMLCPAFRDYFSNTFSVKSPYDYSFKVEEDGLIQSKDYDQHFFNNVIQIRNTERNLVSFMMAPLFIFPSESVEMSQIHPSMGSGDLSKKTNLVPATFNPFLHQRPLECAYWLNYNNYNIKLDDDLYYIKFHTNKKIKFQRIGYNKEILDIISSFQDHKDFTKKIWKLYDWYDLRKKQNSTKRILNIIKEKCL